MDEAVKMGKTSATGSFQLFIGKSASTIMLAVSSIIIGIFIAEGELGLYAIALVPAVTFSIFQDWGISLALTKYCANYRAKGVEGELRNIIVAGLTFGTVTGLVLTLFLLLTANFVAITIFNKPESAFLLTLTSITILSGAISNAAISIFVGFERMKLSTIVHIVSAIAQSLLSALLVYFGFGAFGAVIGYTVGSITSGVASVLLLYFIIIRKLPSGNISKKKFYQTLKPLLHYGIPLSIAALIGGVLPQIENFLMASYTDVVLIGNFRIATNFAILLSFFIYPIQTVLFPAFSKLNPSKDKKLLKTVFASSIKYSSLFLVPTTIALMILAAPIISTIFGDKWLIAPFFLTLYILGNLLVLLGNLSFGKLLTATGETKMIMKLNIIKLCIGVPLAFLLIPSLGILGLIITGFSTGIPSTIIGIYWTWKRFETKADLRNSARILLASAIAGLTTFLFLNTFAAAAWIMLTTGVILFLVVYLISIPLVGAVNQMDISNLRVMFSELGSISKLLEIPLKIIEKAFSFKEKHSKIRKK